MSLQTNVAMSQLTKYLMILVHDNLALQKYQTIGLDSRDEGYMFCYQSQKGTNW